MGITFTGFEDLERLFKKGAKANDIAKKAVDRAAPVLEGSLKGKIAGAASRGYATGELAGSISSTKAKVNDRGVFAAVRPTGHDWKGVRNAEKMAYLEYGTSRGQAPHPVRDAAAAAAEGECISLMEQVVYEEMEAE